MDVHCSFASFAPYAFIFAGIGFACGFCVVVILSHMDNTFSKLLTNGLLSQLWLALKRASQSEQPADESEWEWYDND